MRRYRAVGLLKRHEGKFREAFLLDPDVQDAAAYRILAIGGASRDLGDDVKARH